ncbi:hypothetical protein [Dyella subtropica]|uniref:hypothetical protein n=1 Tax=Dyella subtropica TaxID=2992127 RepID=UPI00225816D8|nr:hypothetical protein [Dyella subtropica]
MHTKNTMDADPNLEDAKALIDSPTAMQRPRHSALDTIETAALDEVQHEAALRESVLRSPR